MNPSQTNWNNILVPKEQKMYEKGKIIRDLGTNH
jgi:hypothetical protein